MQLFSRLALALVSGLFAITLLACATSAPPATPAPLPTAAVTNPLGGGVLATFELNDQHFKVWVTNPQAIEQLLALRDSRSQAKIPNGKILRGSGEANYNAPWNWHLDPQDIEMAEMTTEVCDAEPDYVEANIAEFVDVVGRYCPWSANLVSLQDFR
jgi:hypothetical protein